jgi:hypothetical protein
VGIRNRQQITPAKAHLLEIKALQAHHDIPLHHNPNGSGPDGEGGGILACANQAKVLTDD